MEYSTHYDYFIKFDAVVDSYGEIIQYNLASVSDNFERISKIKTSEIIGKSMTQIMEEYGDEVEDFFSLKDIYNHIGPNAMRKFEKYIGSNDRWYLVNIFNGASKLIILHTDITVIKKYLVNNKNILDNKTISQYYRDGLTGLYTKDFFKIEVSRLDNASKLPLSIIIGDLNGLKLINDAFGYHMGDEAIKTSADILKKGFSSEDIISRFGGDEFVILLPQTSKEETISRIEDVKELFPSQNLDFLELRMSFGYATKDSPQQNIMNKFKFAEEMMYFNKLQESKETKRKLVQELRNRLISYGKGRARAPMRIS